jgi:DUF4097 and DUF4098 domain-containing protein YvlB
MEPYVRTTIVPRTTTSLTLRLAVKLAVTLATIALAGPLVAQTPTPPPTPSPTPAPPPTSKNPPSWSSRSHRDDDEDDAADARREAREATREAAHEAAEAAREAAREARDAVAENVPQAMAAMRESLRDVGPEMRDMEHEWRWNKGKHHDDDEDRDADEETSIDTTLAFAATGGVIDLELLSGEITVRGWSRAEARVHATSESGPIDFDHTSARISLDAHRGHGDDCEFDLTVPYGTRVLMRSNSGDLHYLAVKGEVEARSVSGGVDMSETKGSTTIETVSGDIRARDINGSLRINTISGTVELASVTGDIDISSVSGDITLPDARSRVVRMESVSGTETFGGTIDPAGRYDFHSHSGDISLRMPGDVNASLSLQTFSGDIDSDFKLTLNPTGASGRREGHHIDTTIGNGGGAHVTIETFSGDVRLERRSRTSE